MTGCGCRGGRVPARRRGRRDRARRRPRGGRAGRRRCGSPRGRRGDGGPLPLRARAHPRDRARRPDGDAAGAAHRRIADGIGRLPTDRREPRLPDLARHLLDAHPLVESVAVAQVVLRAAERAIAQLAYEDAAVLLDRALGSWISRTRSARRCFALGDARARIGQADGAGAASRRPRAWRAQRTTACSSPALRWEPRVWRS